MRILSLSNVNPSPPKLLFSNDPKTLSVASVFITIEIFFRFFKHVLGCRHLLSHSQNGIEIQTYCAIIACLIIALYTGRKPTLRTYEMICFYFCGMAGEDDLLAHLAKLATQDQARQKN